MAIYGKININDTQLEKREYKSNPDNPIAELFSDEEILPVTTTKSIDKEVQPTFKLK